MCYNVLSTVLSPGELKENLPSREVTRSNCILHNVLKVVVAIASHIDIALIILFEPDCKKMCLVS